VSRDKRDRRRRLTRRKEDRNNLAGCWRFARRKRIQVEKENRELTDKKSTEKSFAGARRSSINGRRSILLPFRFAMVIAIEGYCHFSVKTPSIGVGRR
jgi:hypothetical protein